MSVQTHPAPPRVNAVRIGAWLGLGLCVLALVRAIALSALPGAGAARGFMGPVFVYFDSQPFVLLFVTVAAGYALGRVKVGGFGLGATASTLLVCIGVSLWASLRRVELSVPEFASTLMFNLFMFAVGMKVGPSFLTGLRRDARAFITIALFVSLSSIGLLFAVRALFELGPGLAPGILAGANTASPGVGAAKDVYVARFGVESPVVANLSATFAFAYCISMIAFVLMMKALPRWFGRDLVQESQAYQKGIEQSGARPLPGTPEALSPEERSLEVRSFALQSQELAGKTVGELRRRFPNAEIERVRRSGQTLEPGDTLRLEWEDVVVLSGPLQAIARAGDVVGPEVPDPSLRAVGLQTIEVVVQRNLPRGMTVGQVMANAGHGFELNGLFRAGAAIPFGPETPVEKGDVFRVTGSARRIQELTALVGGQVVRPSVSTDMVTLAVGLAVGGLLGTIPVPVFGLKLRLGAALGLLITGIVLSTLRTRNPALGGPFPEPARQLLEDLGLNVFIAVTSLNAGAGVLNAIRSGALMPIVVGTLAVGFIPPVLGWAFGQYRHKLNAGLLSGAVAGARCSSTGLRAAQEDTKSAVPGFSYPVTYAISSILITLTCYLLASVD